MSQDDGSAFLADTSRPRRTVHEATCATDVADGAQARCISRPRSSGGDRYLLHVHTDLDTLKADGEGAESELEDRCCVSAETSRRMACDSSVLRYLHDDAGEPLNIGRKTRTIRRRSGGP
ncbi:MAG: hypothetical protein R3200_03400 [Xanthomonadales bacterium]|nr:hypothetical protein [Xanthomonadales bacterium]